MELTLVDQGDTGESEASQAETHSIKRAVLKHTEAERIFVPLSRQSVANEPSMTFDSADSLVTTNDSPQLSPTRTRSVFLQYLVFRHLEHDHRPLIQPTAGISPFRWLTIRMFRDSDRLHSLLPKRSNDGYLVLLDSFRSDSGTLIAEDGIFVPLLTL